MKRPGLALALLASACRTFTPEPVTVTRVDTVTIVHEVAPALPEGDTTTICLSNGMPAPVLLAANGDTLIGDARVSLKSVRPVLTFAGSYAEQWPDTVRFEKRVYRLSGVVVKRECDELKHVGEHNGVPIFAEITAPQPLPAIVVPVRAGYFQNYRLPTPARRR